MDGDWEQHRTELDRIFFKDFTLIPRWLCNSSFTANYLYRLLYSQTSGHDSVGLLTYFIAGVLGSRGYRTLV